MNASNRYDSLFQYYAAKNGLDWRRLKAQGMAESNLNPAVMSPVGAAGLMQFMPATFEEWATRLNLQIRSPYNPELSIACGAAYMKNLLVRYGDNWEKALAAYNWGMGNVDRCLSPDGYPKETRDYISHCKANFAALLDDEKHVR